MNRRFFTSLKLSLAASVMLALGAAQAHATDTKIYGGGECVRASQSGGTLIYVSGSVFNDSTAYALDVECPAIHDSKNNFIYGGSEMNYVRVVDRNDSSNFLCSLNSAYFSETSFSVLSTGSKSNGVANASVAQKIQFGSPSGTSQAITIASDLGHHYVTCRIPPRQGNFASILDSYQVTEID